MDIHASKPEKIKSMFSKVAKGYDKANNVLSIGIHHLWRKKLVELSQAKLGHSVLDCATGTGDLAIEFKKTVGNSGTVLGTDFCKEMLDHAPMKAIEKHLKINFEIADVMHLQYADSRFDITSISFGIRNVADPLKGIAELARVTKDGGKVCILEFGQIPFPVLNKLYEFYSTKILPKIGGLITGEAEAYSYLQKSSADFPCRDEFVKLMKKTHQFSEVTYYPLSLGIAYIYIGTVKH
ncbi:MAG: bifunctional demethylmenaquinone methyltransferase/2-methoxy-6-polyprenyl-1,4-benzoquinol methylase UbiE [Bdellovibrionaceae bacterium]|nr:bifunctional demethylmenaquinone methyltransferase/2-methoxy-6-polyprenyl-1,4-benzoquinol methylase UbiE [Pseudobdellovibrionaceae bacterium]NUM58876.1 bifunctional demethylmenaquinone methyltransferase/2-methoxy-6-polyprenyl-1,4-benzoquinol methylase UbiE [Pseudobdellovibrionaceae bacterium]